MDKLTEKQKRFIDYYIQTGNATESCRLAGYKGNNLDRLGHENLRKLENYIEPRIQQLDTTRTLEIEQIFEFWSIIINDTSQRMCDRLRASEILCKALGGFIEKREINVVNIEPFKNLTTDELRKIVNNKNKKDAK